MKRTQHILALGIYLLFLGSALADRPLIDFKIAAQPLDRALTAFGQQSGLQIAFYPEAVADGLVSRDVRGQLTPLVALEQLLANTDLKYEFVNDRTIKITRKSLTTSESGLVSPEVEDVGVDGEARQTKEKIRLAGAVEPRLYEKAESDDAPPTESTGGKVPEVLVKNSRILNMDIPRSRDDAQPYVVFDRETIENSGALNLEDFFKQRLPQNTQFISNNQTVNITGNGSKINLRGFGTSQTLILIDGHRTVDVAIGEEANQHDINGIPLSAIERVEILPTTASAIYGGSATGGVVNIVLRRDYQGVDTKLVYDNAFGAEAGRRRIDIGAGFVLEDGKTSVLLAGSYEDANSLTQGEQSFTAKYLAESYDVGPAQYLNSSAPPTGATTNIRSISGAPLVLDNGTILTSAFTSVAPGYSGPTSDAGAQLAARGGQYNLLQPNSAQRNGTGVSLLPATEIKSLNATINRDFSHRVRVFLEGSASENFSSTPWAVADAFALLGTDTGNPFQQSIVVVVPADTANSLVTTTYSDNRIVGGIIVELPKAWKGEVDYAWSQAEYKNVGVRQINAAGRAAVSSGALNVFRDTNQFPPDYSSYLIPNEFIPQKTELKDTSLRFAGPVGSLPGGAPQLSMLLESRDGKQGKAAQYAGGTNTTFYNPERSQSVDSAYLEARLPIISTRNSKPAIEDLELQVSGRHDRYTTRGVTGTVFWTGTPDSPPANFPATQRAENKVKSTDLTVSLSWKPVADVSFRASYGTGFLPPSTNQLITNVATNGFTNIIVTDPLRGNTRITSGDRLSGGNPNLKPEESESWSTGFILTPRIISGLRISVDYLEIRKTDNIAPFPGGDQAILLANAAGFYPERVTRAAPSATDIAQGWAGPIATLDSTLFNVSRAKVEAFDAQLDYQFTTTAFGSFDFFLIGTYQPHYTTQTSLNQPELERVGFFDGVLKRKANAGVNWTYGSWALGWNTMYFDSYRVYPAGTIGSTLANDYLIPQGSDSVPSQIYHNFNATYRFANQANTSWLLNVLSGAEAQIGVRNVFNKEPPRYLRTYSSFGDPRLASYWISLSASFGRE